MNFNVHDRDLKHPGLNVVSVLPPSHGDLFVEVRILGKVAYSGSISDYHYAVKLAHAFANRVRADQAIVIKVLCLSAREVVAMHGFKFADRFEMSLTAREEAELYFQLRRMGAEALESKDPRVSADARCILRQIGAIL